MSQYVRIPFLSIKAGVRSFQEPLKQIILLYTKAYFCFSFALSGKQKVLEVIFSMLLVNDKISLFFLCHNDKHFDTILKVMENEQKGKTETLYDAVKSP